LAAKGGSGPRGSFWPSERQLQLLAVALGEGDASVAAWEALRPGFVLDELEPGSFDLMALVHQRLVDAGYDDPLDDRLRGIYRREWLRANVLAERTKEVATVLRDAELGALFVGGAVVAARYYPALGLRPSWYVDVLVREADAPRTLDALTNAGWSAPEADAAIGRWALVDRERIVCVVRTSVAYDFVLPDDPTRSEEPLWAGSEPYDLDGVELSAPAPTDTLLAVIVAGARAQATPSVLWIVDAVMILRHAAADWPRLVDLARSRGQALRLHAALAYVSRLPGVAVPPAVLAELAAAPVTRRERLLYALSSGSIRAGGSLPELAARHLAATIDRPAHVTVAGFPAVLRSRWGLETAWQLPLAACRRAGRRLRGAAGD
jgi:hypothetical protein